MTSHLYSCLPWKPVHNGTEKLHLEMKKSQTKKNNNVIYTCIKHIKLPGSSAMIFFKLWFKLQLLFLKTQPHTYSMTHCDLVVKYDIPPKSTSHYCALLWLMPSRQRNNTLITVHNCFILQKMGSSRLPVQNSRA